MSRQYQHIKMEGASLTSVVVVPKHCHSGRWTLEPVLGRHRSRLGQLRGVAAERLVASCVVECRQNALLESHSADGRPVERAASR